MRLELTPFRRPIREDVERSYELKPADQWTRERIRTERHDDELDEWTREGNAERFEV